MPHPALPLLPPRVPYLPSSPSLSSSLPHTPLLSLLLSSPLHSRSSPKPHPRSPTNLSHQGKLELVETSGADRALLTAATRAARSRLELPIIAILLAHPSSPFSSSLFPSPTQTSDTSPTVPTPADASAPPLHPQPL